MRSIKKEKLLSYAALLLLLGLLLSAAAFPMYPDEVAYKMFLGRFFQNGWLKQTVTPYCESSFLQPVHWSLLPAAFFWSWVSFPGHGFWSYRWIPLLMFVGIIFLILRLKKDTSSFLLPESLLKISFGPIVFGLIIFRPEIVILFSAILLYSIFIGLIKTEKISQVICYALLAFLLYDLVIYVHPKAIYTFPLLLFTFGIAIEKLKKRQIKIASSFIGLALISVITFSAIRLHSSQFLYCPEVPSISKKMNTTQSVNLIDIIDKPLKFVSEFRQALSRNSWKKFTDQMVFRNAYEIGFLPSTPTSPTVKILNIIFILTFVLTFFETIYVLLKRILRTKGDDKKEALGLGLLFCSIAVPSVLNLTKTWYDVAFAVGGLYFISCLVAAHPLDTTRSDSQKKREYFRYAFLVLVTVGSQWFIGTQITRHFWPRILKKHSSGKVYEGPNLSWLNDFKATDQTVKDLLEEAKLPVETPMIVDDLTYDFLKQRSRITPITYFGLMPPGNQENVTSIRKSGFAYGIVRCGNLTKLENILPNISVLKRASYLRLKSETEELCLFSI
ncbi:MAG: hypothetical protein EBQ92_06095 [Proteobacteria bacterium]|nr:hypothetical protein [Pseudomonadota bacterium]